MNIGPGIVKPSGISQQCRMNLHSRCFSIRCACNCHLKKGK